MKSIQRITGFLALCSVATLFVACANQMEPAKNALDNINTILNSVSADAQKYVPDQFAQAQGKVAGLAASFERKDYAAVVAGAPAVLAEVNGLAGAAAAKKDELVKALGNEWRSLAASVPQGFPRGLARCKPGSTLCQKPGMFRKALISLRQSPDSQMPPRRGTRPKKLLNREIRQTQSLRLKTLKASLHRLQPRSN
jgi:hypothetical protein